MCFGCARCKRNIDNRFQCEVSYKALLIHYLATECARAKEMSRDDVSQAEGAYQPYPERKIRREVTRLRAMGGELRVPRVLKRVHPNLTVELLVEKIQHHDNNFMYKTLRVCPDCSDTIAFGPNGAEGRDDPETLSRMSYRHDIEGDDNGLIDAFQRPPTPVVDGMPGQDNVRRRACKMTRDMSDFAGRDLLAKLRTDPTYSVTGFKPLTLGEDAQGECYSTPF